jgi:arylsulfatase A-like enzyme
MARRLLESDPWGVPALRVEEVGSDYERRVLTLIRALVKQIDDAIGQVVAELDQENTVMFFTSDHGDYGGHRGLMNKAPWMPFDDLARVPLIVTAPDARGGTRSSDLVQSHDLALTFLDYAGVAPPTDGFVTRSLRPQLKGVATPGADDRMVFTSLGVSWPMARRGRHKLIFIPGPKLFDPDQDDYALLLFDMEADPTETRSLADEPGHEDILDELHESIWKMLLSSPPELPSFALSPS